VSSEPVEVFRGDQLAEGDPTPGMRREVAFSTEALWAGLVHTDPGASSGWHHHGEHETSLYVVRGAMRLEFGPGGGDAVEAAPGDFLYVPRGAVHRESNPSAQPADIVVVRAGQGESTINVDGPPPPA
jgi:uncharacterized RmlC-like cupin family protein